MKTIKNIFGLLLVCMSVTLVTACGDDVDYTPAEPVETDQVFFSNDLSSTIILSEERNSFPVQLQRAVTDKAATVTLTTNDATGHLSVPTSVEFSAGTNVANILIGYNPADFVYDEFKEVTISVADEAFTTPYGSSSYTFSVGVPAPWTKWKEFGKGAYNYSILFPNEQDPGRTLMYRSSLNDKEVAQFKIMEILNGVDLLVDYNPVTGQCLVPAQNTKVNSQYGEITCSDVATYLVANGQVDKVENVPADYLSSFNPETGELLLCMIYYVKEGEFGHGYELFQLDGFTKPDYSLNLATLGNYVAPDGTESAVVNVTMGKDVEFAQIQLFNGALSDNYLVAAANGMVDGTIPSDTVTASGYRSFSSLEEATYTLVGVAQAEGQPQAQAAIVFEFRTVKGENPWKSLGMCAYTDDIVTNLLQGGAPITYPVEIEENSKKPGLYRLVNAYGSATPFGGEDNTYVEVDAQDPSAVVLKTANVGVDFGAGATQISSLAHLNMLHGATLEQVKGAGMCGALKDQKITFPTEALAVAMEQLQGGAFLIANQNGATMIDMSNLKPVGDADAKLAAKFARSLVSVPNLKKAGVSYKEYRSNALNVDVFKLQLRPSFLK